jgi:hypothetical protein
MLPDHPTIKLLQRNGWRNWVDQVRLDVTVLGSGHSEVERFQAVTVAGSEVRMKARSPSDQALIDASLATVTLPRSPAALEGI